MKYFANRFPTSTGFDWSWSSRSIKDEALQELHDFYTMFGSQEFPFPGNVGFRFNHCDDGRFSVKIMRKLLEPSSTQSSDPIIWWSRLIPLKVRCFVWRAAMERIPVAENLIIRGINVSSDQCSLCGVHRESVNHLLLSCEFSKMTLMLTLNWCGISDKVFDNIKELIMFANTWGSCRKKKDVLNLIIYTSLWNIWIVRNNSAFKQGKSTPIRVVDSIVTQSFEWAKNRGKGISCNWIEWTNSPFTNL